MSHDYHEGLPGFDPEQILVDGCRECEGRSRWSDHGICSLDPERFADAWARAHRWRMKWLTTVSWAELPLLETLSSVQAAMDRNRWTIPQVQVQPW